LNVTFVWEVPKEMELQEGLKDMAWVKDHNSKLTIDPQSTEVHPQLTQFTLKPKSVDLQLVLDNGLSPVGYRHYESTGFDVIAVSRVPLNDVQ